MLAQVGVTPLASFVRHRLAPPASRRLLLFGAGKVEDIGPVSVQRIAGAAIRNVLKRRTVRTAAFLLTRKLETAPFVQTIVEGALMGAMNGELYRFKQKETAAGIETLDLISELSDAPDFATGAAWVSTCPSTCWKTPG